MSDLLLRIGQVSKTYPTGEPPWKRRRVHALDDVTLTVSAGHTLGFPMTHHVECVARLTPSPGRH